MAGAASAFAPADFAAVLAAVFFAAGFLVVFFTAGAAFSSTGFSTSQKNCITRPSAVRQGRMVMVDKMCIRDRSERERVEVQRFDVLAVLVVLYELHLSLIHI